MLLATSLVDWLIFGSCLFCVYVAARFVTGAEKRLAQDVHPPQGQSVPYERFKAVDDQLKAYKDLGFSAEELHDALVFLAAFVEKEHAASQAQMREMKEAYEARHAHLTAPQAQPQFPESRDATSAWTQQQWEEWLLNAFPWRGQDDAAQHSDDAVRSLHRKLDEILVGQPLPIVRLALMLELWRLREFEERVHNAERNPPTTMKQ